MKPVVACHSMINVVFTRNTLNAGTPLATAVIILKVYQFDLNNRILHDIWLVNNADPDQTAVWSSLIRVHTVRVTTIFLNILHHFDNLY